eukprot:Protomagalhaensia_sp_Gyna_25__1472@NODE_174_length_4646_cov_70_358585_g136_i0_p2_GENE_NODE_174_length_4646_cov_70_358585_g136_i0NODE_174_length_4646_cov_70_358585_g136_i0_p2_ORF_typecomplete_len419_score78_06NMT/PF01233_19/1_1e65NMT/PF01233_19/8_5NMT_C/PF02799_15/2_5e57Acetyltransf_9/PF13527_7/3_3e09Acetyltransf_9/PF13527_7/7_3e03Acetyltransf_10/PF13673_7/0_013Acetyltransf_1/PF00583_25/0_15Acetyltransf_7/PF13508_7/0_38Acetyltransf_7/PF13508_7/4_4e03_NODE_174_length_4646_cov_70_358585_g136_i03196
MSNNQQPSDKKRTDAAFGHSVSVPVAVPAGEESKIHRFWDSQPVPKVTDLPAIESGPVDEPKTVDQISVVPLTLPPPFEWKVTDIKNPTELTEVADLLSENYVEDDDACFRFDYSAECLHWALTPPGYQKGWHLGVVANNKMVAFISAIPAEISVHGKVLKAAEVNFLCVHKKLRHKRLAPVLIKEITRRINLTDVWQAIYTAGIFLPKPVGESQYWHRSLNIRKLIDVGFSHLPPKQTLQIAERLLALPPHHKLTGIRLATNKDAALLYELVKEHWTKESIELHPVFNVEEIGHWLLPKEGILHSYVREVDGKITDYFSFYSLPSRVIKHNAHYDRIEVAYCYYVIANSAPRQELLYEALIAAKLAGFDVFNALDLAGNRETFTALKFGIGDGCLRYYLYNWKCPPMACDKISLVLL